MFVFDDICEACFSVVLPQCPTLFAYQSAFDILLSWLLDLILNVFACVLPQWGQDDHSDGPGFRSGAECYHAGGGNRSNGE